MTQFGRIVGLTFAAWLVLSPHLLAHHSVVGQFDPAKPVTLQGVITRVAWGNPHVWIYMDVARPNGTVVNWAIECAPPGILGNAGIDRAVLTPGNRVTVTAYRARSTDDPLAHAYDLVSADGRRFVIGLKL
jgi:hypothetical protein